MTHYDERANIQKEIYISMNQILEGSSVAQQIVLPSDGRVTDSTGSVFFIGTATTLIRCGGFTILTDPNFIHMHEQVDLGNGLSATRLTNPALDIHELPPIDLVVLSHFHGDHFDQVAERELDKELPIVTTPQAAEELRKRGFTNTLPLETWSNITVAKGKMHLRITSMPGRHGPPVVDFLLPDVMGTVLEFYPDPGDSDPTNFAFKLYITGDTLFIDDLQEIPVRYPELNLALLHLGGTRALGILVTMDADQGIEMMHLVKPEVAIPIHYNDYDVFKDPLENFQRAVQEAGLQDKVKYLAHGETFRFNTPWS
jgi:L-ascorbate metabolism protein UlaG (beta-lactamase superfamily)